MGPSAILDGSRKFRFHRIRPPNRPARSQSLPGLSYPGPFIVTNNTKKTLMSHWKKVESYGLNLIWQNFTGTPLRVMRFLLILLYVKEMKNEKCVLQSETFYLNKHISIYIYIYIGCLCCYVTF